MPTVVVVDDEAPYCRALRKMIEEAGPRFQVLGEAFNGEQALDMLAQLRPDVLFTDIRMPVMDGLQLIAEAKRRQPEIATVIVSSYDDFHYTRKAIQLQAEDYLLKPVTIPDLQELLMRVEAGINEQVRRREKELWAAVVEQGAVDRLSNSMRYAHYVVYMLCAGSMGQAYEDHMHPGKLFWQSDYGEAIIRKMIVEPYGCWILDTEKENERFLLIGSKESVESALQAAQGLIQELLHRADWLAIPLTIVQQPVTELSGLKQVLQTAGKRMRLGLLFGRSSVMDECTDRKPAPMQPYYRRLGQAMELRQKQPILDAIFDIVHVWEQQEASQITIENGLKQILFMFPEHFKLISDEQFILAGMELDSLLLHSLTYPELLAGAEYTYSTLMDSAASGTRISDHQEEIIVQIEHYLQANYSLPITLQDLSRRFNLVPNYLSAMFKKFRGVTPGEYLTQWRVHQAKKLMSDSSGLLLKDIADRVGYSDPLYFSRVFKKVTGLAPSDYMK
ncbi:response regulator transcription factor [Paenibacillus sp. FSL H8-0034]|uniref:response regulator transcription factor n=1 Tax=Paenibacillus sp. FSL H8-0034 TaxID=2954671 RepID=UPI0030F74037